MEKSYREKLDKKVPVNRIIPFSAVDGPGNRTAIFLQGCNIDCKYCHNPETRNICTECLACVEKCPTGALSIQVEYSNKLLYDREKCIECDTCIRVCQHDASPKVEWLAPYEVFLRVKKQVPFIRGITVSGGECMLYPAFIKELFQYCRNEGLSTLIDSNGMISFKEHEELLSLTDGVMLDIKTYSRKDSFDVVGADNTQVLSNVTYLAEQNKLEEIRTVIVDGLFDANSLIEEIGDLLSKVIEINSIRYKLIAFRPNGVREQYKHYSTPTEVYMEELKTQAKKVGFKEIIII